MRLCLSGILGCQEAYHARQASQAIQTLILKSQVAMVPMDFREQT